MTKNTKATAKKKLTTTGKKPKSKSSKVTKNLKSDSLFKSMMTEALVAREFIEEYVPAELKTMLDLDKVKVEPESFVEEHLKKRISDIVYSVPLKDKKDQAFVYILAEHVRHEVAQIKSVMKITAGLHLNPCYHYSGAKLATALC